MVEYAGAISLAAVANVGSRTPLQASVAERRAQLVVQCARDLLGEQAPSGGDLHLPLSVTEFERALRDRYGNAYPELVYRTDSTLERARLERRQFPELPKVVLRQGAPRRADRVLRRVTEASDPGHP